MGTRTVPDAISWESREEAFTFRMGTIGKSLRKSARRCGKGWAVGRSSWGEPHGQTPPGGPVPSVLRYNHLRPNPDEVSVQRVIAPGLEWIVALFGFIQTEREWDGRF